MSKKKLNTDLMVNELKQSRFFARSEEKTERSNGSSEPTAHSDEMNQRSDNENFENNKVITETNERRNSLLDEMKFGKKKKNIRETTRYSFEIYKDQVLQLEELKMKYRKKTGDTIAVSKIIREALDDFFAKLD